MHRLKKFIRYYGKYKRQVTLVLLCSAIATAAALQLPLCVSSIAELALSGEAAGRAIGRTVAVMIGLAAVELITHFYFDVKGHALGARMETDLRNELFTHLEKQPFAFYNKNRVGVLMSSLTNDMLDLTELFHHGPEDYIMSSLRVIGAAIILLIMDVKLGLVTLAFVPVMAALTLFWGKKVRQAAAESQENIANINAYAQDNFTGIRTVTAYSQEESQVGKFRALSESFYRARVRVYLTEALGDKNTLFFIRLMLIAVVSLGGFAVSRGEMEIPELIAYTLYVSYLTEPVQRLAWMVTQFQTGMAGFDRVCDLLETQPEITDEPDTHPLDPVRGNVRFENVSFAYEAGHPVLDDCSFALPAGAFAALVGTSGEGKTTIGTLIPRFYEPQQGIVYLDEQDIRTLTLNSLRSQVAWAQQEPVLFDCSIADNIRMGNPGADMEAVRAAAVLADADGFITALPEGYDTFAGERGGRMSGGQRQRIALARALLKDAPVLILDEATNQLDRITEKRVMDALQKARAGKTTLVISHRLSAIQNADIILVLKDGRIVQQGTHESLLAENGEYALLWQQNAPKP